MRANTSGVLASLCFAGVLFCGQAIAVPITYEDTLSDGVTVAGVNNQPAGEESNPVGAEYYRFFANAGSNVTVWGDRLAGHFDMSFWIFQGVYADTSDFGAAFPGAQGANLIDFGDDDDPPNIAGPFGDPRSVFVAPVTGFYTIAVTNFLSNAGPPNPFELTATGIVNVPEPGTALLIGLGLAGFAFARRRASR
jgi:hypothetical protein